MKGTPGCAGDLFQLRSHEEDMIPAFDHTWTGNQEKDRGREISVCQVEFSRRRYRSPSSTHTRGSGRRGSSGVRTTH